MASDDPETREALKRLFASAKHGKIVGPDGREEPIVRAKPPGPELFAAFAALRQSAAMQLPNLDVGRERGLIIMTAEHHAALRGLALLATQPAGGLLMNGLGFTNYPSWDRDDADENQPRDDAMLLHFIRTIRKISARALGSPLASVQVPQVLDPRLGSELPPLDFLGRAYQLQASRYREPINREELAFFAMLYDKINGARARRGALRWAMAQCRHRVYAASEPDAADASDDDNATVAPDDDAVAMLVRRAPDDVFRHACQFL